LAERKRSHVAPNPLKSTAIVTFDKTYEDVDYRLLDVTGRICAGGKFIKCIQFPLDRGNISPGVYILKLMIDNQFTESQHIIISD
jgi:hypothetical protein